MVIVAFALMIFFAVKTRRKMNRYDKSNILWDKERIYDEQPPNVEEWVSVLWKSVNIQFCFVLCFFPYKHPRSAFKFDLVCFVKLYS